MRLPDNVNRGEATINMTPMIDVVFLLIIFFLVSSHLANRESHMPLDLPLADAGREPVDDVSPRVTVNVTKTGEMQLSGFTIDSQRLQQRLAERLERHGKDLEVRIRTSRQTPYGKVEPIMLACARVGIWNVTYAVYRREDVR
ncbi:MAG: biopolymer transporter ExbD [Planctomycetes bacterium]|nr:biopolymer transporter ExbD [Planctomycetota bacterium]